MEQLAKDTEELKAAEQKRTERLDAALLDVESVVSDLKASNRRREDDAQKIRDEINALKEAVPKAMQDQRDVTDNRMREVNGELASLKTLMTQRLAAGSSTQSANPLRPTSGNTPQPAKVESANGSENAAEGENSGEAASAPKSTRQSSFKSGRSAGGKASIPAWQMAMAQSSPGGAGEGASGQTNGASSSS